MKAPVLTAIIFIFVLWLQYQIRRSSRKANKDTENFWNKEAEANLTRRKDISTLDYITLNIDQLPLADQADETANSYRNTILKLSNQKILNLSGISNTELKTRYGAANLDKLSEYDNNYIQLVSILHKWAERLFSTGDFITARKVLEFAIYHKSDVSKSYKLLAEIYLKLSMPDKIKDLLPILEESHIPEKDNLILFLKNRIPS